MSRVVIPHGAEPNASTYPAMLALAGETCTGCVAGVAEDTVGDTAATLLVRAATSLVRPVLLSSVGDALERTCTAADEASLATVFAEESTCVSAAATSEAGSGRGAGGMCLSSRGGCGGTAGVRSTMPAVWTAGAGARGTGGDGGRVSSAASSASMAASRSSSRRPRSGSRSQAGL